MAVLPTLDNLRGLLQRVIFVPIVYGFISLLPMFLTGWENSDRLADRLFSTIRSKENMFDFIVVGGGTAGALVANRLAEHYRVLLLEAGGTPMPFQTIPALALKFLNHPQTDWSHKTQPQRKACLNSVDQRSSWSSGRGLGGTTNINFMTHVRGHPMDYDSWAEQTGDPGWSYHGVLPYFKRFETFSGTSNDPEARGHDGELRIRKPSYIGLSEDWVRAGQEIGYPFVDLNGRHEEGFGILQYPIYKGIRQSTYASFLLPMHKSPRLTIRRYALVRKVLFRDMNNMAYGVEYVRHGYIQTAIATKEVILSAGTMGSAKLLMLSGVGPKQHLDELGIPVRSQLPVGLNLQDHLAVHLGPFFIKEPKSFLFDRDVTPENIVRWLFLGTGPITTTGYQGAASVVSSVAKSRGETNWPDLHLILHGQAIHQGYTDAFAYAYSLQEDELMQYYNNAIGRDSFHIYVVGARPTSKGRVLLSGASISDPMVIDPKYLEDGGDFDFKILMEGVKTALNIANTSMFQRLGTEFTKAKLPGCHEFELGSDAYWECYIRRFTLTMHNPVGTAAMGLVTDPDLKVRGTRGLRVVDASVQPTLVCTGTAASTLMIAEKGVDMILRDHGIPDRDQDLFDVIFGKNGFFKKNPILKILQREFDQINPLRALFKPFISVSNAVRGAAGGVEDGVYGENRGDIEAKERFTRNGRLDNPLLQVISAVFGGNSYYNQGDKATNLGDAVGPKGDLVLEESRGYGGYSGRGQLNETVLTRRSTAAEEFGRAVGGVEIGSNVISKNQWVLHPPIPKNITLKINKKGASLDASTGLKITEVSVNPKKKGGKRYALLQKILKEIELNETLSKLPKTTITTTATAPQTSPPPPQTSPSIVTTVKTTQQISATTPGPIFSITFKSIVKPPSVPVVKQVVQFEKPVLANLSDIDNHLSSSTPSIATTPSPLTTYKSSSLSNSLEKVGEPDAKQIGVTPSSFGLLPALYNGPPPSSSSFSTPTPLLTQFFNGLRSFEGLVRSFTAKDNIKPLPLTFPSLTASSQDKSSENLFKVSSSQNLFHPFHSNKLSNGNNNGNIFSFLNPPSTSTSIPSSETRGPFHFLFGGNNFLQQTTPNPPTTISIKIQSTLPAPPNISTDLSDAVGFATSGYPEETSASNKTTREDNSINDNPSSSPRQNNFFSNWFKPPPKSDHGSSSWFKPFDKPSIFQQSPSSWFKPISDLKPSSSSSSWFKPFGLNNNDNNKNDKSTWFNPLKSPSPEGSKPPKSKTDPFTDLFELFFGGLKKNERRAVFKTMGTLLEAGEGLADILGVGGAENSVANQKKMGNFFENISKGKRMVPDILGLGDDDKLSVKSESDKQLLKSLIALNQVISTHHSTTSKPNIVKSTVKLTDDNLEEFLSTFRYPPPAPSPSTKQI